MICFEILVNGQRLCTAGVGEFGVFSTILHWVQNRPEDRLALAPDEEWRTGEPHLHVGGLVNEEHLDWFNGNLKVGDEVTIRIIESNEIDEPSGRHRTDPEEEREQRRAFYEDCKREFEGQ